MSVTSVAKQPHHEIVIFSQVTQTQILRDVFLGEGDNQKLRTACIVAAINNLKNKSNLSKTTPIHDCQNNTINNSNTKVKVT